MCEKMSVKLATKTAAIIANIIEEAPVGVWIRLPIVFNKSKIFPLKMDSTEAEEKVEKWLGKALLSVIPRSVRLKAKTIPNDDGILKGELFFADLFKIDEEGNIIVIIGVK